MIDQIISTETFSSSAWKVWEFQSAVQYIIYYRYTVLGKSLIHKKDHQEHLENPYLGM